jgi:sugar lactone lactonase YvrE
MANGTQVPASYGGTKLVCVSLSNNTVIRTIVFPSTVALPESYFNDVRFDLRPSLTKSGGGVAYITDSSAEGKNALVVVDLGTGESWRKLEGIKAVRAAPGFVPYVWGMPLYFMTGPNSTTTIPLGADGIALSADGKDVYLGAVGARNLYSIPASRLLDNGPESEMLAEAAIQNHGERGLSDRFETDTNGFIYAGNTEQNGILFYNPRNSSTTTFVQDPRIIWVDTSKFTDPTLNCSNCR